jgi:hypothetical protein
MKTIEQWQRWLTENTTGAWKSGTVTYALSLVPRFMIGTWRALVIALVIIVLLPWLALDLLLSHRSKPSTFPAPSLQKPRHPYHSRPHLRRNGSDVFWEMPDGEIIPLEPLQASLVLQEVAETVGAALCYEKTRLRGDSEA